MATGKIKVRNAQKPNDVIYTPLSVAKLMIDFCDIEPNHRVLDPSMGTGIFYDNFPECNKDSFKKFDTPSRERCSNI